MVRHILFLYWLSRLMLFTTLFVHTNAQWEDAILSFESRPDLRPPRLYVTNSQPEVTPGYIFMAPYNTSSNQNTALIYDAQGQLVWSGFGLTGGSNSHDFHVCSVGGEDHLCFYNGIQSLGYGRGHMAIFDNTLTPVRQLRSQNGLANIDQHETHVTADGRSALVTIYNPIRYDLSEYNITTGVGWVMDSVFQRIDIATGRLMFEWSAIEHVGLSESNSPPNTSLPVGTGFNSTYAWDYFHINSVDMNSEGDYLISARHTSTLYKISGQNGTILWRCGGNQSDFVFDQGAVFSYQHDARWKEENPTTEIITIFDNGSNGPNSTSDFSSGMILQLDHSTTPGRVSLLRKFNSPQLRSDYSGNFQLLGAPENWASSHAFIGWGSRTYITESDALGNIIFTANLAQNGIANYRAYKFNFTTNPPDNPALYTYAQTANSITSFYMSWNGATEVRQWRIYGRNGCEQDFTELAVVDKTGFETRYNADRFVEYGLVEALDGNGNALRNSTSRGVTTFVPYGVLLPQCGPDGCEVANEYVSSTTTLDFPVPDTRQACASPLNGTVSSDGTSSGGGGSGSGGSGGSGLCSSNTPEAPSGAATLQSRIKVGYTIVMVMITMALGFVMG